MRAEAMPGRRGAVGFERIVAEPAELVVDSHGRSPFTPRWSARAARPMPAKSATQTGDQVEHAQDLGAIAHHLAIAGLPPAQHAVPVDHERGAPGDVAVRVEDAIGADGAAVQV